jgi:hypothetical protein
MRYIPVFLLCASVAYACGDDAYRCVNVEDSVQKDYKVTKTICDQLAGSACYCARRAEYYCETEVDNIEKFKQLCKNHGTGWGWRSC